MNMFDTARREIGERTLVSRRLLALMQTLDSSRTLEAAACKGLILVQLYGVYEYAVHSAVQATLAAICDDGLCCTEPSSLCSDLDFGRSIRLSR
jgi:hypothetical protein